MCEESTYYVKILLSCVSNRVEIERDSISIAIGSIINKLGEIFLIPLKYQFICEIK